MSDENLESLGDLYRDPNGPAYQQTETRNGPPLGYVSEKLRTALSQLHALESASAQMIERGAVTERTESDHPTFVDIRSCGRYSFYSVAIAFLALNNMLATAESPSFVERLLAMSHQDFNGWLDHIETDGSVT